MQDKVYIHYGHNRFDRSIFKPIKNKDMPWVKPTGGLWASPIDADYGWRNWCNDEKFRECVEGNSFKFTLPDANILYISSVKDTMGLPIKSVHFESIFLDFEELVRMGYDAIELNISSDRELYWRLYGWDCDSILVMNPNKIQTVTQVTATGDIMV